MRVLQTLGGKVEVPTKGSHYRAIRDDVMYPIPAHNGLKTEIGDVYIRGMCRALGLDFDEFKKLL